MSAWWTGLNTRERGLVGFAIGITLLVLFWQFVLAPTLAAKADAKAQVETSAQTLDR